MSTLPTRVYAAFNEAGAKMYGSKKSYKGLRQQISDLRYSLANTAGLQKVPLAEKRKQVYPVMVTNGFGGFMNLRTSELCILGVNEDGEGCISCVSTSFDDFLIYFCNYNIDAIRRIFERARKGDPMTLDEVEKMDMSGDSVYYNNVNNTVHNGQIINASGNARISAPMNITESIPSQFRKDYNELVNYLQYTDAPDENKNSRITQFIQNLTVAGFGEVVGQVAQYLFSLV